MRLKKSQRTESGAELHVWWKPYASSGAKRIKSSKSIIILN